MNQQWFEMGDIRRRKFRNSVWVPLRAIHKLQNKGKYGYTDYIEEFFGAGSLAVPVEQKSVAENLGWSEIGIGHKHRGFYQEGKYIPADVYEGYSGKLTGLHLVLDQRENCSELNEWHLHQDFVVTLGLKREGNIWVSTDEGYIEVARLHKEVDGKPFLLEVRAEHLKDYLNARNMGLYITSYFSRDAVVDDASFILWKNGSHSNEKEHDRWEGRVIEIHEGGNPFGKKWAVFHVSRTDVDETDDIPDISDIPTDKNTASSSWELGFEGSKLYRVRGELWRNEWIEPARISPRVKGEKTTPSVFFIVDEQGNKENKETLARGGKWLWFNCASTTENGVGIIKVVRKPSCIKNR